MHACEHDLIILERRRVNLGQQDLKHINRNQNTSFRAE